MGICNACGAWLDPSALEFTPAASFLVCPVCGHREPLRQYPLWWIAGSSGSGKSTLMPHLRRELPEFIVFEGEAIDFWRFDGPPGDYSSLYNQWLKVAHQIALNGHPVVLVATALPQQLDACTFRPHFSPIHYLGLVCTEGVQRERLLARPAWRKAGSPEFVAGACSFTRHLESLAREPGSSVVLHDTAVCSPEESAAWIAAWVRRQRLTAGAD
jgi:energy-coupling factor transporter ATP-binding protein EcfA2